MEERLYEHCLTSKWLGKPNWQNSSNLSDVQPRSEPALELHSRAASSVGVMYRSSNPNTGSNSGGGWIQKKRSGFLAAHSLSLQFWFCNTWMLIFGFVRHFLLMELYFSEQEWEHKYFAFLQCKNFKILKQVCMRWTPTASLKFVVKSIQVNLV